MDDSSTLSLTFTSIFILRNICYANVTIREKVDQDDRGNDHTEQNCPGVESAKQQGGTLLLLLATCPHLVAKYVDVSPPLGSDPYGRSDTFSLL
jgi:hypothetical protein